jgi:MYXO-CTERM domain-containing protein
VRQLDGISLVAGNASDPEGDSLTYRFEISNDPTFPADATITSAELPEGLAGETTFGVDAMLQDNTFYFYRVRARDGRAAGPSCTSRFRVDLVNEPPSVPTPINPWIDTVSEPSPRFVWAESTDPEGDDITYEAILYHDAERTQEVWRGRTASTLIDYDGVERLPGGDYWWQVRAEDEIEGHSSEWSMLIHFIVPGEVVPTADAAPKPDAAVVDATVEVDAMVVDAAEPAPDAGPVVEVDAAVQEDDAAVAEQDAALAELDAVPEADAVTEQKNISRSVSGAGCSTAVPGTRGTTAALGLMLVALAGLARRRRR